MEWYCSWFPNDPVIADGIFYVRCLEVMINLSDVNVDGIFEWIIILTNWPFCLFLTKKFNDFIVVIMRTTIWIFTGWIWWCHDVGFYGGGAIWLHHISDMGMLKFTILSMCNRFLKMSWTKKGHFFTMFKIFRCQNGTRKKFFH